MKLKPGVKLKDLQPQMALAAMIVRDCYESFGATCTVTSANDSRHSPLSLHYMGQALDFRTKDFPASKQALLGMIRDSLGTEFDVLLEGEHTDNEHIHVEYDVR